MQEYASIKDAFLKELQDAQAGQKTSLPFIKNTLPSHSIVADGEEFQVIVIGGTHATVATCKKQGDTAAILAFDHLRVPLFETAQVYFEFLDPLVLPATKVLALNFAFPLIPEFKNNKLDGKLLRGVKDHAFAGFVGKLVGEETESYFLEKRNQTIQVSCANDTICLLLSGLEKETTEKLGAGIVGSGMNFAFFLSATEAVNLESASFDKFTPSDSGVEIDTESANPGYSMFEKEVSGVYLYKHYNKKLEEQNGGTHTPISETVELDFLARNGDKTALDLLHRSAKLIGCQVAAIMDFRNTDMTFVMEGSVFWKGFEYRKTVEQTVSELTTHKAEFVHIQDSNILGPTHLVI